MKPNWSLSVKVDNYLADKVAWVDFSRPFVQCLISMGLTEEECLQEVTNGNNVPDSNQQAAVSPSTYCQLLIFTITCSQIHPLSTMPKPAASKRRRPKGTASVITSSPFRKKPGRKLEPRCLDQASSSVPCEKQENK
jgi:hypothetical protein